MSALPCHRGSRRRWRRRGGSHDQLMTAKGFGHDRCMSRFRSAQRPSAVVAVQHQAHPGRARHASNRLRGAAALGGPQARALAFSRSNSDWSIAPASSSSLALAICSAGVVSLVAATLRT
jgi:hypothetical protein